MNALGSTKETPVRREVPHNLPAEQELLGAILINNTFFDLVSRIIQPEHFYEPLHRKMFEAAGELIRVGRNANPITLRSFLPKDDKVEEITIAQYLARPCAEASMVVFARDHALSIHDL